MGTKIELNGVQAAALRRRLGLPVDAGPAQIAHSLQVTAPPAAAKPAASRAAAKPAAPARPAAKPAAGKPVASATTNERDRIVSAAVSAGRIAESDRAEWLAKYDGNPQAAHSLLTNLLAVPARPAEEPSLLDEMRRQQAAPMAWANAGSQPQAAREPVRAASAASASGSRPQVVRDDVGNLTYAGYAVKINSAGQACVFADANGHTQWMPVEEFERANLGLAALEAAGHFGSMLPTGQLFNLGPS